MANLKHGSYQQPGSGAGAVTLDLGFDPDRITVYNITDQKASIWVRGMADAAYMDMAAGTYTQTNGVTPLSESALFGAQVSAFSAANPGVITASYVARAGIVAGDTIVVVGVADDGSATSLNGEYTVASVTATTITTATNTTSYSAYVSGGYVYRKSDTNGDPVATENFAVKGVLLGTDVAGGDSDSIMWVAEAADPVV